ncbi:MAG TPA: NF038122 family metalloprotease [Tepidisphaeraceae bacterium]|nr:NF038122 family metalloprotease [Tepidisphaeraceae bacterium]
MAFAALFGRPNAQSRATARHRRTPNSARSFTVERLEPRCLLSLTITPSFDSSVQADFPQHIQQFEDAFNYAAGQFQNLFSGTNVAITLKVEGSAKNSGALGETLPPSAVIVSQSQYPALQSKLPGLPSSYPGSAMVVFAGAATAASESGNTVTVTEAAPNRFAPGEVVTVGGFSPSGYNGTYTITAVDSMQGNNFQYIDGTSGLPLATTLGSSSVQGAVAVPLAEARALGLYNGSGPDATIIFDSNQAWDFNPADRTSTSGGGAPLQDFIGVAEHEIAHALGRISFLGQVGYGPYAGFRPLDLQRYYQVNRTKNAFDPQGLQPYDYLSPDQGQYIEPSYPPPNVGDFGDWAGTPTIPYNTQGNGGSSAFPITAATQGGLNVNVSASDDYVPGEEVSVQGLSPSEYDGVVTVTAASPSAFYLRGHTYGLSESHVRIRDNDDGYGG